MRLGTEKDGKMPASLRRGQRSGNNHAAVGSATCAPAARAAAGFRAAAAATRMALAICLSLLLAMAPAGAQDDPLVQRGVPAEATAETAVLAREQALNSGQRIAYERMAAALGLNPRASDAQIEGMVRSLIIESERISARGYTARITVNFSPQRVAAAGGRAPASPFPPSEGGAALPPAAPAPALSSGAVVTTVDATASYRTFADWIEINRRLAAAAPVARVQVISVAADGARLRLSLRAMPPEAAADMANGGLYFGPGFADPRLPPGREGWRLSLAGGR
jgi:hypothetical protein